MCSALSSDYPSEPAKCEKCGGVLPGRRGLCNLFTRCCRCDPGADADDAYLEEGDKESMAYDSYPGAYDGGHVAPYGYYAPPVGYGYAPPVGGGTYYTWAEPEPTQVIELFRPNPLPELPASFKRIRAEDARRGRKGADDVRRRRRPRSRSRSTSRRRRSRYADPAIDDGQCRCHPRSRSRSTSRRRRFRYADPAIPEPAITFNVDDARRRLLRVRDSTTADEPLHPFLDLLLDTLDDVAPDGRSARARRPAVVAPRRRDTTIATPAPASQPAPATRPAPAHEPAAGRFEQYPTPPPSPPEQVTTGHVPSPRVPPTSPPRAPPVHSPQYPIASPDPSPMSPQGPPATSPPPHVTPASVPRHATARPLRGILRNAPGNTGRPDHAHLPTPDSMAERHNARPEGQASPIEPSPHPASPAHASHAAQPNPHYHTTPRRTPAAPQAATPAVPAASSFSPPRNSAPLQTPIAQPQPSRPVSVSQFSPLLRVYGATPSTPAPRRVNAENSPSPSAIYVRYESSIGLFSILAPEAVMRTRFQVFGQSFWSVSQALAWAKAYRYMHESIEGTHGERASARARMQEILNLAPNVTDFVDAAVRLYEETPNTPSWAAYEFTCAEIVTRAKFAGPDPRAREMLLDRTGDREIY